VREGGEREQAANGNGYADMNRSTPKKGDASDRQIQLNPTSGSARRQAAVNAESRSSSYSYDGQDSLMSSFHRHDYTSREEKQYSCPIPDCGRIFKRASLVDR